MPHYQQNDAPEGLYRRPDGTRVDLLRVENIRTPQGYNIGWVYFADDAAALAAWGLVYDPQPDDAQEEKQPDSISIDRERMP